MPPQRSSKPTFLQLQHAGVSSPHEPSQSPFTTNDKEHRIKQQVSSQTANFIASHTPTTLSNAKGVCLDQQPHLQILTQMLALAASQPAAQGPIHA